MYKFSRAKMETSFFRNFNVMSKLFQVNVPFIFEMSQVENGRYEAFGKILFFSL